MVTVISFQSRVLSRFVQTCLYACLYLFNPPYLWVLKRYLHIVMGMLCTCITDIKLFPPSKLGTQEQAGWLIIKTACDALHDLVLFVKFKKRKNTHGGVLLLLKVTLLHGSFTFFKLYKCYQIVCFIFSLDLSRNITVGLGWHLRWFLFRCNINSTPLTYLDLYYAWIFCYHYLKN